MTRPEPGGGLRFGSKIVLLLVLVVLAAQAASFGVMRFATERSVRGQMQRELDVGQRVWERFHESRRRQLLDRVAVLAEDFGFREAVTSGDEPTMISALANSGGRIGADAALLLDPLGNVQVALVPDDSGFDPQVLRTLLTQAGKDGFAVAVVVLDGRPHQLALVPVFAPALVGWVGLTVDFGDVDAREFSAITGLATQIITPGAQAAADPVSAFVGATSAVPRSGQVGPDAWDVALEDDHPSEPSARAMRVSVESGEPVFVLLRASRTLAMAPFADLGRQVLALSAAAALLALAIAVLVGRQVSRPVDKLARAALRIQRGEYAKPVEVAGRDELAQLASAFNQMQAGIAEREATIVFQAGHDRLTGLPNRERALQLLQETLHSAAPGEQAQGAVLMLDIDRFKEINDTLGHAFGDRVLVQVAERLREVVRGVDTVSRLGADEFLVLLAGLDRGAAEQRAELLAHALRQPFEIGETVIQLDCSIGIALLPQHGDEAETLLRRSDIALYDAKQSQGGVAFYASGRDEQHLRQLKLISDLRSAIERDELSLLYQPKVTLISGRVEHAEALLRWRHPELGTVPPDEFIPLAERAGLIQSLTLFVLDTAIGQVRAWQDAGLETGVAVNLSVEDLLNEELPERVQACLRRHAVSPGRLILEVTESAVMRDLAVSLRTLHEIRRQGILIAIDDFGTGQSSLAQLKRLPIDELKIDKSFVLSLAPGGEDELIVRSIIDLAHTLSMRVVAEGVESAVGLALLRQHGCETVQGYYFSRPMPSEVFVEWVKDFARRQSLPELVEARSSRSG